MENKNILLVIASVCLLLIIVVGVGLWIFWPNRADSTGVETAAVKPLFDKDFDSYEFYRTTDELPGLMEKPETEGSTTEEVTLTIGEAEGESVAIEDTKEEPISVPVIAPAEEKPRVKEVAAPPPAISVPVSSKAKTEKVLEYEIQLGSYKSRSRAEAMNKTLKELGIAGVIRTRAIEDETYYRVRVGPYSNLLEAEKFLEWIVSLDSIGDGYISQVTRVREVN